MKVVKSIQEFRWTIAKLALVLDEALDKDTDLTHFSKFIKGVSENENGKHRYQGIQLKHYK